MESECAQCESEPSEEETNEQERCLCRPSGPSVHFLPPPPQSQARPSPIAPHLSIRSDPGQHHHQRSDGEDDEEGCDDPPFACIGTGSHLSVAAEESRGGCVDVVASPVSRLVSCVVDDLGCWNWKAGDRCGEDEEQDEERAGVPDGEGLLVVGHGHDFDCRFFRTRDAGFVSLVVDRWMNACRSSIGRLNTTAFGFAQCRL